MLSTPHATSLPSLVKDNEIQPSRQETTCCSSTCKKILRIVAIIFLTIFTLGLYLIWKFCCPSSFDRICPLGKGAKAPEEKPKPLRYAVATTSMQKLGISPNSPEYLYGLQQQQLQPEASKPTTIFGDVNRGFLCTYPLSIRETFAHKFSVFQEKVATPVPPQTESEALIAEQCLSQLQHLDAHYFIAQMFEEPYDFYRAYMTGWLCALMKEKSSGNTQAFKIEAKRLKTLAAGQSFLGGPALTQQAAQVLEICDQCHSLQALYDNVILNPDHSAVLISYFKEVSFHAASNRKLQMLGESGFRNALLAQIDQDPELFKRALFQHVQTFCRQKLLQEQQYNTKEEQQRQSGWWPFWDLLLRCSVVNPAMRIPAFDALYQKLFQTVSSLELSSPEQEAVAAIISEITTSPDPLFVVNFQEFKSKLCSHHAIASSNLSSSLSFATLLLTFFLQSPKPLPYSPKYKDLANQLYATLSPILQKHMDTNLALPAGELPLQCLRTLALNLPSAEQCEEHLLQDIFQLLIQEPQIQTAFPFLQGSSLLAKLYAFDPRKVKDTIALISSELPNEWRQHVQLLHQAEAVVSTSPTVTANQAAVQTLANFLHVYQHQLQAWSKEKRISTQCSQKIQSFLQSMKARCTQCTTECSELLKWDILYRFSVVRNTLDKLQSSMATNNQNPESTLVQYLAEFILHAPINEVSRFSRTAYYRIEEEHIACMASLFGDLALCQSLCDEEIPHNEELFQNISAKHGFLSLNFVPEHQGRIFLFRHNGHYSALLPKSQETASKINNH